MAERRALLERKTGETDISIEIEIDGTGQYSVDTGIPMLDHMLSQLARHGAFDINVKAQSSTDPDGHHMVEDVAILLGQAFGQALGSRTGIVRMSHAMVPLDEALALVAVDIGGRGYAEIDLSFSQPIVGGLTADMARHFLETFAIEGRCNIHAKFLAGMNDHHKIEALFKALAKSLDAASRIDERTASQVPSTKGIIEN